MQSKKKAHYLRPFIEYVHLTLYQTTGMITLGTFGIIFQAGKMH